MFDDEPEEVIAEENETDGKLRCPMCNQFLGPMKPQAEATVKDNRFYQEQVVQHLETECALNRLEHEYLHPKYPYLAKLQAKRLHEIKSSRADVNQDIIWYRDKNPITGFTTWKQKRIP